MRWLLVDTETTGISVSDKVCEMAYVEIDDAFNVIRSGNSLINPGIPINYAASAVNGITDVMVKDAPTLDERGRALRGRGVEGEEERRRSGVRGQPAAPRARRGCSDAAQEPCCPPHPPHPPSVRVPAGAVLR